MDKRFKDREPGSRRRVYLSWLLVMVLLTIIFCFSAQAYSSQITARYFGALNSVARKLAHLIEYGSLFSLLRFALSSTGRPVQAHRLALLSFSLCLLYAVSDELHQALVPGRTPSVADVLWDASGALIAWLLWQAWCWWKSVRARQEIDRRAGGG